MALKQRRIPAVCKTAQHRYLAKSGENSGSKDQPAKSLNNVKISKEHLNLATAAIQLIQLSISCNILIKGGENILNMKSTKE